MKNLIILISALILSLSSVVASEPETPVKGTLTSLTIRVEKVGHTYLSLTNNLLTTKQYKISFVEYRGDKRRVESTHYIKIGKHEVVELDIPIGINTIIIRDITTGGKRILRKEIIE